MDIHAQTYVGRYAYMNRGVVKYISLSADLVPWWEEETPFEFSSERGWFLGVSCGSE
jgi:hypothetical protein